ncbi:hypothetical protein U0070_001613 [Myodes glareolus]|uniref:Glyceraldehyde 3-phosphate dehydrogenase NAD(P) binding domain-containing protein n=1 Tax=Myodes glareolus TaxID=447135 RepID=A0AAW0J7U1_MYOGA
MSYGGLKWYRYISRGDCKRAQIHKWSNGQHPQNRRDCPLLLRYGWIVLQLETDASDLDQFNQSLSPCLLLKAEQLIVRKEKAAIKLMWARKYRGYTQQKSALSVKVWSTLEDRPLGDSWSVGIRLVRENVALGIKEGKSDPILAISFSIVYLFQNDSTHGKFNGTVSAENGKLVINRKAITNFQQQDPANIR